MTSSAKNENMTKKNLKQLGMGSHEFSPNQKIVSGGFPWTLGTELKNCFQWEFKPWGLEYGTLH